MNGLRSAAYDDDYYYDFVTVLVKPLGIPPPLHPVSSPTKLPSLGIFYEIMTVWHGMCAIMNGPARVSPSLLIAS